VSDEVFQVLLKTALASSAALILVALLRKPMRIAAGAPPLLERNHPYVASKLRSRVAGLENLAASRLRRRAFGRCRATKPASRAARMAPTPAFAAA